MRRQCENVGTPSRPGRNAFAKQKKSPKRALFLIRCLRWPQVAQPEPRPVPRAEAAEQDGEGRPVALAARQEAEPRLEAAA
jgi:hypothetical protein